MTDHKELIAELRSEAAIADRPGQTARLEAIADALEAAQPRQIDRDALMKVLNDAGAYCGECGYEDGYGDDGCSQCEQTLASYADAILESLSTIPATGEVEWEYVCEGGGYRRFTDDPKVAEKWQEREYSIRRRTKPVSAGPWVEVTP